MKLHDIFYDRSGTLRSGWRFGFFLLLFILLGMTGSFLVFGLLITLGSGPELASPAGFALNSFVLLVAALTAGWFSGRVLEGLPFRALGASVSAAGLRNLAIGCGVGAATILIAVLIAFSVGGLRFELHAAGTASSLLVSALTALGVFTVAAAFEEALFRGYILQTFARSGLAWFAILLTSVFFGVAHLSNPNSGYISTLNTMLAGIWFGVAYLKTRDLWFVTGIHLTWNWLQGAVFGIEVSGLKELTPSPLLREIDSGPTWLTGGEYGLEGGIACTIALVLSIVAIWSLRFLRPDGDMLTLTSPRDHRGTPNTGTASSNLSHLDL